LIRLCSQLLRITDTGFKSHGSHNDANTDKQPQAASFPIEFWHLQTLTRARHLPERRLQQS